VSRDDLTPVVDALAKARLGDWPEHAIEDLGVLIALGVGAELSALSPESQAAIARFTRRAGLEQGEPGAALRRYLEVHPIPPALLAEIGAVARGAHVEQAGERVRRARHNLGHQAPLRPVEGSARAPGSLLQLRLRGQASR